MANNKFAQNTVKPNKITAPYNFVPLNEHVYCPDWASQVSQDIPFSDGEDGCIEVTWRNISPLCIRDASDFDNVKTSDTDKSEGQKVYYSMNVKQPDGSRRYFIPGSSLRGMLRNTLNIMSFGKMSQYDDKYMGYREVGSKTSLSNKYRKLMEDLKFGWLEYEDGIYYLYPCRGEYEKIRFEELEKDYGNKFNKKHSAWERNQAIKNNTFPNIGNYAVFATGWFGNKRHELLIPEDTEDDPIRISERDIVSFFTVYENTPDFDKYKNMLQEGRSFPVGFLKTSDKRYVLGMGRMIRYPYRYSIKDLVEKEQKPEKIEGLDLCETIFGMVDENNALKGRVQFCNAFVDQTDCISNTELKKVKGVLGSPKLSYYPLYLKQDGIKYKTYDDEESHISGRKLYRIHKGTSVTELPSGNNNENTLSEFYTIPAGHLFTMRIVVHNLKPIEIGALLSTITFHNTKGLWHNIGTAKGFGYGKIECDFDSIKLNGFSKNVCEYLQCFEKTMNEFISKYVENKKWVDTVQMKRLAGIMSEHEDSVIKMMDLKGYGWCKKKFTNFENRNETGYIKSVVSKN